MLLPAPVQTMTVTMTPQLKPAQEPAHALLTHPGSQSSLTLAA